MRTGRGEVGGRERRRAGKKPVGGERSGRAGASREMRSGRGEEGRTGTGQAGGRGGGVGSERRSIDRRSDREEERTQLTIHRIGMMPVLTKKHSVNALGVVVAFGGKLTVTEIDHIPLLTVHS